MLKSQFACVSACVRVSVLVSNCWASRTPPSSPPSAEPRGLPPHLEPETKTSKLSFYFACRKATATCFQCHGSGFFFYMNMNMYMNFIWCRFFHIRTEQKDKRTGEQCPAWMEIIFPQFLFKISLKFPTHLPVDVVLKTDGVRRGTIDWQLQNKTWTGSLKKTKKKALSFNQKQRFSGLSFLCSWL